MKRLLTTTAAFSLVFANVQPWPLLAQTLTETGTVIAADGTVLCEPTAEAACDPAAFVEQAAAIEAAMAASAAEAEAQAAAAAAAEVEAAAAAAAAAEAEVKAAADAAAAVEAEAKAAADAAAAAEAEAQAAAEAAAAAEAEIKAAADAAAAAEAEAKAAADVAAAAEAEAKAAADADAAAAEDAKAAAAAAAEAEMKAAADTAAAAEAEAKAAADVAAAAEAEAKAAADSEAAAEAEVKAAADSEAAAEAEMKATADSDAAAEAEVKATATSDAADAEVKATEEANPVEPVTEEAKEEAAVEPAVEEPKAEDAATEEPKTDEAATEEAKPEDTPVEADAVMEPAATEAVEGEVAPEAVVEKTAEEVATEAVALEAAQQEIVVNTDGTVVDPAAGLKTEEVVIDPNAVPVEAPVVSEVEVEALSDLLSQPTNGAPVELGAAASLVAEPSEPVEGEPETTTPTAPVPVAEAPTSPDAVGSVIEVLTEADTRSSSEEFAAAPVIVAPGKKNRLSDLEKVGLIGLSALVIGAIINDAKQKEQRQVVSNTGDRVVVLNPDGTYSVYKDDDTVLRRPGSTVRTETFKDGSTRTIIERADGSQVVTIRDATGRVLRRAAYDKLGRELVLIDDLRDEVPVVVNTLPKPKKDRVTISTKDENAALKAKLAAREAAKSGRTFSLRQIRDIPEVRALAATMDVESVTFNSGSAAITASEADSLADLGGLMQDLLDENPGEVFLIEGHTDATGKAAMNLALSDRRAESVALALTEYFDIPPENMVVQGYGESELLIDTLKDERRNRRVAVRVITPLLRSAE